MMTSKHQAFKSQYFINNRASHMRNLAFFKLFRGAPFAAKVGVVIVFGYILTAIFAPVIAPYGEAQVFDVAYAPWSNSHLLGTDQSGYDIFSRLIYGARNTIGIAFVTTMVSLMVGVSLGLVAALSATLSKGVLDQTLSRVVDVVMAIPNLIFSLMLLTIFGSSAASLILIIAILDSMNFFRLARTTGLATCAMDFVEVARLRGESISWIVFREVLPNVFPPLVAEMGLRFCFVFLTISSLSFLGVGIQPPAADWGGMVRDNATLITYGNITPLLPAAAIGLLVVSVNFVADWFLHKFAGLENER